MEIRILLTKKKKIKIKMADLEVRIDENNQRGRGKIEERFVEQNLKSKTGHIRGQGTTLNFV